MKLKRFLGKDMQETMLKIKMELGNEAVVLNTRKIRNKGFFKFFSKPMIEILVGIEEPRGKDHNHKPDIRTEAQNITREQNAKYHNQEQSQKYSNQEQNTRYQNQEQNAKYNNQEQNVRYNNQEHNVRYQNQEQKNGGNFDLLETKETEQKMHALENKISKMESLMVKVYDELKSLPKKNDDNESGVKDDSTVKKLFYNNLLKNEIESDVVVKLMTSVEEKLGKNSSVNETAGAMFNMISEMLGKPETVKMREDGMPTVIIFIGPTGVGKTTTLAKIAANYSLNHKKQVGLITADTYRIAAVDQLKTYADILGIPVSVIYSPAEVTEAIEKLSGRDIILIDTAGRSAKEKEQFEELKQLITYSKADEVYLVLSSTTSITNCREIINSYSFLEDYKLIFTKLDESPVHGVVLNTKFYTNKSLSYMTTGQSVPDDIEIADTEKITKNLLGSLHK